MRHAAILTAASVLAVLPLSARAQEPSPVPSPSAESGSSDVKVAGRDVPAPKRTHFVSPVFPPEAQAAGLRGIVILELLIDPSGKVATADVIRSVPPFDDAALVAARQWTYETTKVDGKAVPVRLTVPITFALRLPDMTRDPGIPELRQGAVPPFPAGEKGPATVVADVTLLPDGTLAEAAIREGDSPWAESMLQALRTWRFGSDPEAPPVAFEVRAQFQPGPPPRVDLHLSGLRTAPRPTPPPATPGEGAAPAPGAATATTAPSPAPAASPAATAAAAPTPSAAGGPPPAVAPAGPGTAAPPASGPTASAPSTSAPAPTAAASPAPVVPSPAPAAAPSPGAPPTRPVAAATPPPPVANPPVANPPVANPPVTNPPVANPPVATPPRPEGPHPSPGATPPPVEVIPGGPPATAGAASGAVPAATPTPPPQNGISAVRDVNLGPGVPDLTKGRRPVAPPFARMSSASGTVQIQFSVDAAGGTSIQNVNGPDLLKEAARQAVGSWSFRRTSPERLYLVAVFSYEGDKAQAEIKRAE